MSPNLSIEATSRRPLRTIYAAPHVKRWVPEVALNVRVGLRVHTTGNPCCARWKHCFLFADERWCHRGGLPHQRVQPSSTRSRAMRTGSTNRPSQREVFASSWRRTRIHKEHSKSLAIPRSFCRDSFIQRRRKIQEFRRGLRAIVDQRVACRTPPAVRLIGCATLAAPVHHAGRYVEWTNEREFLVLGGWPTARPTASRPE